MSNIEKAGSLYAEMIYPTIKEEHKTLLSFGMLDVSIHEKASSYFKEVVLDACHRHYSMSVEYLRDKIDTQEYKRMENEFQLGLYSQLLTLRKQEGKLVC